MVWEGSEMRFAQNGLLSTSSFFDGGIVMENSDYDCTLLSCECRKPPVGSSSDSEFQLLPSPRCESNYQLQ